MSVARPLYPASRRTQCGRVLLSFVDDVTYSFARSAIEQNTLLAESLGLAAYNPASLVTPEVSGLENPAFLQAAYDAGVRYLVSDDSQPGYSNPSPNMGIYNSHQPALLMIPRHASSLGFDVSTPGQWVAAYNQLDDAHESQPSPKTTRLDISSDSGSGKRAASDVSCSRRY